MSRKKIAAGAVAMTLFCSFGGRAASAASETLTVEGNTLVVSSGITQGAVTFNGRQIIDSGNGAVTAHGTYPAHGKTFVLVETDLGPSCAMFQIVAVAGRQASVSPVFGNCGDAPIASVVMVCATCPAYPGLYSEHARPAVVSLDLALWPDQWPLPE